LKFLDGSTYEGEFVNDEMTGEGTYLWGDGRKYVGRWENSKMNGKGILIWPDG